MHDKDSLSFFLGNVNMQSIERLELPCEEREADPWFCVVVVLFKNKLLFAIIFFYYVPERGTSWVWPGSSTV